MKKNLVMCHGQFLLKNKILLTLFASDGLRLFSHVIEATYDSWVPLYLIVFFLPFAKIKQSLGEIVCEDDSTPPCHNRKRFLSRSSLTFTRIHQEGNVPASASSSPRNVSPTPLWLLWNRTLFPYANTLVLKILVPRYPEKNESVLQKCPAIITPICAFRARAFVSHSRRVAEVT